jgi:hypothetical protein
MYVQEGMGIEEVISLIKESHDFAFWCVRNFSNEMKAKC